MKLESCAPDRVDLTVQIEGHLQEPVTVSVRTPDAPVPALLALETLRGDDAAVLRNLPAGDYQIEIERGAPAQRYRFAFTVSPTAAG
jgi:hypothetical protein